MLIRDILLLTGVNRNKNSLLISLFRLAITEKKKPFD